MPNDDARPGADDRPTALGDESPARPLPKLPHGCSHAIHAALAALPGPIDRVLLFDELPTWIVTGYEEVKQVLDDDRLIKDWLSLPDGKPPFGGRRYPEDGYAPGVRHLFGLDAPDHTRLRRVTQHAFSARATARWRPLIRAETDRLLDALVARGGGELVGDVFEPLSVRVLCAILGVPDEYRELVREGGATLFGPLSSGDPRYLRVVTDVRSMAMRLLRQCRNAPAGDRRGDDIVTLAATAWRDGTLSASEAVGILFQFIAGNTLNTVSVLANGAVRLMEEPQLAGLLRDNPVLLRPITEELLRLTSATALSTWRFASRPMTIAGTRIDTGDVVLAALDHANHDSAAYPGPDRLLPGRPAPPHQAFGHGRHYCAGAELARAEIQTVLVALTGLLPHMKLAVPAEQLPWSPLSFLQGISAVPVTVAQSGTGRRS
ncbi:cytochrome P450 [Streptomyces chrestomyceticus]|uniref:cytochrome P450 n=1 Tax=Streptomyces chrestomyceticus TaxID=68185 RepID=UPI0033D443CA